MLLLCDLEHVQQSRNVSHAQQPADEALGVECLEVVDVLARADEDDRRLSGSNGGQCTTTLGVTVEFGDDDGADGHRGLECLRLIARRLSDGRVHGEDDVVGRHHARHLLHLLEQRGLLLVTTGRVHDDDLILNTEAHTSTRHTHARTSDKPQGEVSITFVAQILPLRPIERVSVLSAVLTFSARNWSTPASATTTGSRSVYEP